MSCLFCGAPATAHHTLGGRTVPVCARCLDRQELQDALEARLPELHRLTTGRDWAAALTLLDALLAAHGTRDHDGWLARSVLAHRALILADKGDLGLRRASTRCGSSCRNGHRSSTPPSRTPTSPRSRPACSGEWQRTCADARSRRIGRAERLDRRVAQPARERERAIAQPLGWILRRRAGRPGWIGDDRPELEHTGRAGTQDGHTMTRETLRRHAGEREAVQLVEASAARGGERVGVQPGVDESVDSERHAHAARASLDARRAGARAGVLVQPSCVDRSGGASASP